MGVVPALPARKEPVMKQYICVGRIINKRGIRGELKLESYCESPSDFEDYGVLYLDEDGKKSVKVQSCKEYKGFAYLKLEGTDTPEAADALRGNYVYVNRDDIMIDDSEILIEDIIGLSVYDADTGKKYGDVTDVVNYGGSDLYVIAGEKKEYMLPAVDEFVVEIDLENGIKVRPIPGLFDDDGEEISEE